LKFPFLIAGRYLLPAERIFVIGKYLLDRHDSVVFRALADAAPDGIVGVKQEGQIVLVNVQTEKQFGYTREELLGKPIETVVPDRFRGKHRGHRAGYMSSPGLRPMGAGLESYDLRKDGSEFPIEISLSPIQTDSGSLVCSAIRDITERMRAQQRILTLLDSAPDAMVVVGEGGRIVLVNSQTEKLFGYARTELPGHPVEVLVPERFWTQHRKHHGKFMEHRQVRPMGVGLELLRSSPGRYRVSRGNQPEPPAHRRWNLDLLYDPGGYRAQARRRRPRKVRSGIPRDGGRHLRRIPRRPGWCHLHGRSWLATMLGYESEKELLQLNLAADIFEPGEYSRQLFDRTGSLKRFAQMESHWWRKDGHVLPVELSGRQVTDQAGTVLYFEVIVQDISQQNSVEHRLRHVQKMEAVGRLAGGIAHDFNNVLGVITGYSEMLLDKLGQDSKLSALVTHILGAGQRASVLTRQLLAFSR
jgi:PAS domain S-box-containing protein